MNNIEIFRLIVFNTIREIMNNFPAYTSLSVEELLPSSMCNDEEIQLDYCYNTIHWLKYNSYIVIHGEEMQPPWEMVMPTEKMLALMGVEVPNFDNKTFLSLIKDMAKNCTEGTVQQIIQDLIYKGAKLLVPTLV